MGHKIPLKELSVDELFNSSEEISYEFPSINAIMLGR